MRNRFRIGDSLEILSPGKFHNGLITVDKMEDMDGNSVDDAFLVKQKLRLYSSIPLNKGDILRKKS